MNRYQRLIFRAPFPFAFGRYARIGVAALPLVTGGIVLFLALGFLHLIGTNAPQSHFFPSLEPSTRPWVHDFLVTESRARTYWLLSTLILSLFYVVIITFVPGVIYRALTDTGRLPRNRAWFCAAFSLLASIWIAVNGNWLVAAVDIPVFRQLLSQLKLSFGMTPTDVAIPLIHGLLGCLVLIFIAFCVILLNKFDQASAVRVYERESRRLRVLMYLCSGLMAAVVANVATLLSWPSTSAAVAPSTADSHGALAADIAGYSATISIAVGVILTLVLFSGYGMATILLRLQVERSAPEHEQGQPIEKWIDEKVSSASLIERISRIGAILGPMIAGALFPAALALLKK